MDSLQLNAIQGELKKFFSASYKHTNLKPEELQPKTDEQTKVLKEWLMHFHQEDKDNIWRFLEENARVLDSFGPFAFALRNVIFAKTVNGKESSDKKPKTLRVVDGLREGVETLYYPGTQQKESERTWEKGVLEGEEKGWFKNGMVAYKRFWKNNKIDGEEKRWHPNGQLSFQFFWKNQKIVGEDKSWFEDGKPAYFRTLTEDMKFDGPEKRWFDNGQIEVSKTWKNGKEIGEEQRFNREGQELYYCLWENGVKKNERVTAVEKEKK